MRNKLAKNSIAVGLVTLIITAGLSFSAQGAPDSVAQGTATAVKGTGLFGDSGIDLDTGICAAELPAGTAVGSPAATPVGTPAGRCGPGLSIPGVSVFSQAATASLSGANGTSTADASVAPIDLSGVAGTLDLTAILDGLDNIDTATIIDPIVDGLDPVLDAVKILAYNALIVPLNNALQTALEAVDSTLPITLGTDTVSATCSADPTTATGSSVVAPPHLSIELAPGTVIDVPITLATTPNSNLVVGSDEAAQQLVGDLVQGLIDTSTGIPAVDTLLDALTALVGDITGTIINPIIDAIEAPLLTPVGDAIEPILSGTVNKQTPVSPAADEIDVTALSLTVLGENTLDLARVHCGPNALAAADDTDPGDPADTDPGDPADTDPGDPADTDPGDPADSDAAADNDAAADADVTTTLPATGSPNLLPFWMLGLGLLLFGATVLVNEKRRLQV